jgi:succinyl-diaminopimelate desuccinylase
VTDLLARCAELVEIPSVSRDETALADHIQAELAGVPWLEVERVEDNVVARTRMGRERRLILAGHLDTVPPNGNEHARVQGDVLWGLGSADMKGGLAVLCELARSVAEPVVDVTYVFYVCEEVSQRDNGLVHLLDQRPELLAADAAILGEPTGAVVEAGCQGTMRVRVTLAGTRAHTARPWVGRNAVHRLAPVLALVAAYEGRRPVIDGCEYREALQAVRVEGGVAGNVVPDRVVLDVNHRFAPDRSAEQAWEALQAMLTPVLDPALGDGVSLEEASAPAPPALGHPLLARLVESVGEPPRAKLGWTDVSFFAAHGIPAANFGPGDPTLAHTADERVERGELESVYAVMSWLLAAGSD